MPITPTVFPPPHPTPPHPHPSLPPSCPSTSRERSIREHRLAHGPESLSPLDCHSLSLVSSRPNIVCPPPRPPYPPPPPAVAAAATCCTDWCPAPGAQAPTARAGAGLRRRCPPQRLCEEDTVARGEWPYGVRPHRHGGEDGGRGVGPQRRWRRQRTDGAWGGDSRAGGHRGCPQ